MCTRKEKERDNTKKSVLATHCYFLSLFTLKTLDTKTYDLGVKTLHLM